MAKATRSFVVCAALVGAASQCVSAAGAAPPALQEGQTPDPCTLSIGPVSDLTSRWHPAPAHTAIPAGKGVYFVLNKRILRRLPTRR